MHVEQRGRIDTDAQPLLDHIGQMALVGQPLFGEALAEGRLFGIGLELAQTGFRLVEDFLTEMLHQQLGQLRIGLIEPAAEGDAIGLAVDPLRIETMQVGEHGLAHQLSVQPRHAVGAVRTEESQVAHAYPAAMVLLDQRYRTQQLGVVDAALAQVVQMVGVDQVDDLHVPWQQPLHQPHRPGLQRLGQQGVVGVGQGGGGQPPGVLPFVAVHIDQQPHQLGHGDSRVGIVELNRGVLGQAVQRAALLEMAAQQVLQRGSDEEVLLAQTQLLPRLGAVGRIEHPRDALGTRLLRRGADVIASIEARQVEVRFRPRAPQAQRVHPGTTPADDGRVIGDRAHAFGPVPEMLNLTLLVGGRRDTAAEADQVLDLGALELPGVAEIQPGLGLFVLPAIDDRLAEQAMVITDAVAMGHHAKGGHAFHEAGREPPEAAIAERRVRLQQADAIDVYVQSGQRLARHLEQAQVAQAVHQQTADQEL